MENKVISKGSFSIEMEKKQTIKTFQKLQRLASLYGVDSNQHPFNRRNWMEFSNFGFGIILNGAYILCQAETFREYADSIFIFTSLVNTMMVFAFSVLRMRPIFDGISRGEEIINDSEFDLNNEKSRCFALQPKLEKEMAFSTIFGWRGREKSPALVIISHIHDYHVSDDVNFHEN